MASTIKVEFVNSQANEPVSKLDVPQGTTMRQILDLNNVTIEGMNVVYRIDGESIPYDMDDELEDGSRVSITPENIKGN